MYFLYQPEEKGKWFPALASERENLIKSKKPALVTALDVDSSFDHDLSLDETRALRYSGPAYFDWDAEDLEEATQQFQKFLTNLKAKDVNLDMLRLYATGKKGYHCEIPMPMFMGKPPANGTQYLPDMYREMAHVLFVDTLDLRVYTSRRGRMWRCTNVLRDNGKYKVQISIDEAMGMTTEKYMELCSSPRNALPTEPPVLSSELGLIFAQARDKVEAGAIKRKAKKVSADQLSRFKGEWPETLSGILAGAIVKPGVGWNHISLQLCITASELGKTEEQLLADAAPLINSHESDSSRYNSPSKRTRDLRDMFRYISGNPCYEFSVGGVMSLLMPEVKANADISFGEYVPDEPTTTVTTTENGIVVSNAPAAEDVEEAEDEGGKLKLNKHGIFVQSEEGYKRASHVGITTPVSMRKLDRSHIGYEVTAFIDGKEIGREHLPMHAFTSRSAFNGWTLSLGGSMTASDTHVGQLADVFRMRAAKAGAVTYAVEREGVDVITPPGSKHLDDKDVIWASPVGVIAPTANVQYRFHGHYSSEGMFRSDLMNAPDLSLEDEKFISNLLSINSTKNLAKLLGWFSAAALTQIIRAKFSRFPICQVFGQAGAGKSMTLILLNHLYYNVQAPRQISVAGQTQYPLIVAVASSASIPVVFEEVKPRQLNKQLKDLLQSIFRSNYTADLLSRGSLGRDKAVREPTVTDFANAAPIVFVGEAIEDQAAILERCVVIALSKNDRMGRDVAFNACLADKTHMGRVGKQLALGAMTVDQTSIHAEIERNLKSVTKNITKEEANDSTRAAYNLAVVLTGLEFLRMTLSNTFGTKFDERIKEMKSALLDHVDENIPSNLAEASRVLDVMAQLTRNTDPQFQLLRGVDYTVAEDGSSVDLKVLTSFDKYVRYQRSLGMEVLFDTKTAWQVGLANYGGLIKKACPENEALFDSPKAIVYRLSTAYMDKENVDSFK